MSNKKKETFTPNDVRLEIIFQIIVVDWRCHAAGNPHINKFVIRQDTLMIINLYYI